MNNRYLFRGKRTDTGEWVLGHYGEFHNYHTGETTHQIFERKEPVYKTAMSAYAGGQWHMIDESTLGQCTGLSAAKSYRGEKPNDLLIYEGDTLLWTEDDISKKEKHGVCEWSEYGYCLTVPSDIASTEFFVVWNLEAVVMRGCEIIGTIHDTEDSHDED